MRNSQQRSITFHNEKSIMENPVSHFVEFDGVLINDSCFVARNLIPSGEVVNAWNYYLF